jgi:PHD/YefM family antitoxin component YafN of YafNO toxin-antitoxin module
MAETLPLAAVDGPLHSMVRRAARNHERITILDEDEPAAVVIAVTELEDLEDALAVAQAQLRQAAGHDQRIPHDEVLRRLGLAG